MIKLIAIYRLGRCLTNHTPTHRLVDSSDRLNLLRSTIIMANPVPRV